MGTKGNSTLHLFSKWVLPPCEAVLRNHDFPWKDKNLIMLLGQGSRDRQGSPALGYCVPIGRLRDCAWSLRVPSAACSPSTALHVNTLLSKTLNADFHTAALELAPASPVSFLFAAIKLNKWDPGTLAGLQTRVKRIPNWPLAQKYNFQL